MDIFIQSLIGGITVGAIYGLIAIGFNLIFSTTRVLNFAQGEYLAAGALVGYTMSEVWNWSFGFVIFGVIAVMAVVGVVSERLIMIPVRRVGGLAWILTTLGASIVMRNGLVVLYGREPYRFPALSDGDIRFGEVVIRHQQIWIIVAAVVLLILNELFARRTFFGKAIRATAHSYDTAALMGIPVGLTISISFALSAIVTGLAGLLIAPIVFADANMGLLFGLKGFVAVIVGGMGSARGAFVGGMIVGILDTFVRSVLSDVIPSGYGNLAVFALLAAMLLFRPTGIMGQAITDRH
ncbi:MAG: branched-chain amino acid ABC transporter permease [Aggregatilineales bacterium]